MLPEYEIIISDTSCLILLSKINELDFLKKLGRKVYITPEIRKEFHLDLPEWIEEKASKNPNYQNLLKMEIDLGEASAISLSLETSNSILVIDDLKGRKVAEFLKLRYTGTLGLILKAKETGLISHIRPYLEKIRSTDFRINEEVVKSILRRAGE